MSIRSHVWVSEINLESERDSGKIESQKVICVKVWRSSSGIPQNGNEMKWKEGKRNGFIVQIEFDWIGTIHVTV